MQAHAHAATDHVAADTPELPRSDTALRLLYSAVFAIVLHLVAGILSLLVLFQLAFALATRQNPHPRLKSFGDGLARYTRQVMGYVTYNRAEPPFPFADLPERDEA
jgi:hypothetical protein